MKLALIIGHTTADGGAVKATDGIQEYDWNTELAAMIRQFDPLCIRIFTRNSDLPYREQIRDVYQRGHKWGASLSIELHFNSAAAANATGTETFSSGSVRSLELAERVQAAMVDALGLPDRGVKVRNAKTKGRGYESLIAGRAPAVLIEPFFGSNMKDCQVADTRKQQLARAIYCATVAVK